MITKAQRDRLNHYNMNLDEKNNKRVKDFFENTVIPFVKEIDKLIISSLMAGLYFLRVFSLQNKSGLK